MEPTRLNKFISSSGFCSRREADKLIELGRVKVNGKTCASGQMLQGSEFVEVDGQHIKAKTQKGRVYLAFNKPEGITCTTEGSVKGNIVDFINYHEKIFPIGRLDKFSQGLIFMTNDGDIVNKILRAGNAHEKEYIVAVDKAINEEFIRKMSNGVPILDTVTKKCTVVKMGKNTFKIILTQGLNRQIRRMCEYLGYRVTILKRTRIMNVELAKLKPGTWRNLTPVEMAEINDMISNSSKTQEASTDTNKKSFKPRRSNKPFRQKEAPSKKGHKGKPKTQSKNGKPQSKSGKPTKASRPQRKRR
ncbi:MAG: 23S rRNA pseudouridine(2604) synthase RluF [Lentisphaeraceae bacterium]|nr:23S rRNA pseudouridine(2604) synthase RluF [Lentisphaeraceae bacterium]